MTPNQVAPHQATPHHAAQGQTTQAQATHDQPTQDQATQAQATHDQATDAQDPARPPVIAELAVWRRVRRYAVPAPMISAGTEAREAGDWRAACAAVRALPEAGADPWARDQRGEAAVELASSKAEMYGSDLEEVDEEYHAPILIAQVLKDRVGA